MFLILHDAINIAERKTIDAEITDFAKLIFLFELIPNRNHGWNALITFLIGNGQIKLAEVLKISWRKCSNYLSDRINSN